MSLLLEKKRLLKDPVYKRAETWDQLSQVEFMELFFKLNALWYEKTSRFDLVDWLYSHATSEQFLVQELTIRKVFNGKTFYGPGKGFRDLTMGQFMFADFYNVSYHNERRPEDLSKLVAALFIPENCDDDSRSDQKHIDERAGELNILPDHVRDAVLFNYRCVRRWLTGRFTYVFPKKQPDNAPRKMPLPRWDRYMWNLAEGSSDEDFRKIANSKALNILQKIDELIRESEKRKR